MDSERYEEFVRWAAVLEQLETSELRAAGRAIRVLCEENRALTDRLSSSGGGGPEPTEPRGAGGAGREADGAPLPRPARRRARRRGKESLPFRKLGVAAAVIAVAAAGALVVARAATPALQVTGPPSHTTIGSTALATLTFTSPQQA